MVYLNDTLENDKEPQYCKANNEKYIINKKQTKCANRHTKEYYTNNQNCAIGTNKN